MKNYILILFFFSLGLASQAQEFDIRSFSPDRADLRARVNARTTVNGDACALIDVVTNIKGMQFESNIGIVEVKHRDDGYDVYVAPRERSIKLLAPGYLSKDVNLPEPAQTLTVYKLVVATKGASIAQSDLVRVTFRLNEGDVYIRSGDKAPVMAPGRNAVYNLPKGPQRFTFSKEGFNDNILELDISKDEVVEVQLEPGITETVLEQKGFILITSEPSGADVFLNEQQVGTTPYQGRQLPGDYTLALRMPLYYDHGEQFTLTPGGTTELPAIVLKPQFGNLQITSVPSGAEAMLNGKPIGTTPISGYRIGSGSHELELKSSLHHPLKQRIEIKDGEEKNINLTLKQAFGSLYIASDPSGATVYLDDRAVGITPYSEERQPSGSYQVRIESELHSSARAAILVEDDKESDHFFALTKNYGTLVIESDGAEVLLNGEPIGTGSFDYRTAPGSYTITAKKERHDDDIHEVFLTIGQVENVKLTPKPRSGSISIMSKPFDASGAEIWIDGKKTTYRTPALVELLEGEYVLELKKSGYFAASRKLKIDRSAKEEWEPTLFPSGTIDTFDASKLTVIEQVNVKSRPNGLKHKNGSESLLGPARTFINEHPEFTGSLTFTKARRQVENTPVENVYLTAIRPAGPSNALLSAILPGWGTLAVTDGEKGRVRMLLFGIAAGTAVGARLYSNNRYDAYRDPENIGNQDELYNKANLAHQISLIATTVAVSISVYDVIWVVNKGIRNKRQAEGLSQTLEKGWIYVD